MTRGGQRTKTGTESESDRRGCLGKEDSQKKKGKTQKKRVSRHHHNVTEEKPQSEITKILREKKKGGTSELWTWDTIKKGGHMGCHGEKEKTRPRGGTGPTGKKRE